LGITAEKLEAWLEKYPWEKLVNRASTTWKELPEEDKATDNASAIRLMIVKTSVIKRPVIEANNTIITLGFNANEYEKLFL
jgi:arsenate reductase (glutaredoxin)